MKRLEGKVAVILGASAEDSMGAATARRFAAEGAKLVVAARRLDPLRSLAQAIGGIAVACDVTSEEQLVALADTAIREFGRLDIAVNFAGTNAQAPIAEITREAILAVADIHLVGTALFIKTMAARMAGGGSIVTTSSLTVDRPGPGLGAYSATKAAADQLVRVAAVEYGSKNIRVNAFAPGFTRSAMTEGYFAFPGIQPAFEHEIPLGRLGTVQDAAGAVLWLASDECFATGQILQVSGGQTLHRLPTGAEMGF
jgi:NAD(P)-dependent dehydrogenase (short-subunit alcohol dehydrogenase family)